MSMGDGSINKLSCKQKAQHNKLYQSRISRSVRCNATSILDKALPNITRCPSSTQNSLPRQQSAILLGEMVLGSVQKAQDMVFLQ
jgi:hypothetical protein